jgi:thiamine-monophosphate kinase
VTEADFLALLRPLATHPAARGLLDDAAVLGDLVLTHDVLVEGVHFLPDDPAEDVAWKLLAVNLSDLAAKGAKPVGVLIGYPLGDDAWDRAFVRGLTEALTHFDVALLGGDTVKGPRVLSLTAIGRAAVAPSRRGALAGDALWVTGVIGSAGLGLAALRAPAKAGASATQTGTASIGLLPAQEHIAAYRRPTPRLVEGQKLGPIVHAMMDVSDGLLIDARRMADASGLAVEIEFDAVPIASATDWAERVEAPSSSVEEARSAGLRHAQPSRDSKALLQAVTAGDDYELLFALPAGIEPPVAATRIGTFSPGSGLTLRDTSGRVALPERLGWQHGV